MGTGFVATISNYVALAATHYTCMQYGPASTAAATAATVGSDAPNGMIVPGTGLNLKACTDGTSKTVMICETIEPCVNSWYDGTTAWTTGISPATVAGSNPPNKTVVAATNPQGYWVVPAGGLTALQVGPSPNTGIAYSNATAGYTVTTPIIAWGPSSNHSGGVVVHGAVDGSVHNVTPDVDPTVYMHIITRAGREPDALPDTAS
jgi:hypothetical protein